MSRSKAASGDRRRAQPARAAAPRRSGGTGRCRSSRSRAAFARRRPGDERRLALRPRARRARDQAGARRPDRGDLPAARLRTTLPRFGFTEPLDTARDGAATPHLRDLQGSAGRPGARPDLRLHPSAARLRAGGGGLRRRRHPPTADAVAAARPMPRVADILARDGADRADAGTPIPTPVPAISPATRIAFPGRARRAAAERWRAATRAFCSRSAIRRSAAMAATIPSSARSASARSRSRFVAGRARLRRRRSARSRSPNARWSTSSRAASRRRRTSPAATASPSARASARRCRWRWSTARCAPSEFGEEATAPAQDEEFVLSHSDNVQATGFVEHLKLPHYVDFQAELDVLREFEAPGPRSGRPAE